MLSEADGCLEIKLSVCVLSLPCAVYIAHNCMAKKLMLCVVCCVLSQHTHALHTLHGEKVDVAGVFQNCMAKKLMLCAVTALHTLLHTLTLFQSCMAKKLMLCAVCCTLNCMPNKLLLCAMCVCSFCV